MDYDSALLLMTETAHHPKPFSFFVCLFVFLFAVVYHSD